MAGQGVVLDIDTKFLNNLKAADAALAKSITHSKALTAEFNKMVGRTGPYAQQLSAIQAALSKLGAGAKMDFSQGLMKLSTEAITATDKVNLLTANVQQLQDRFNSLKSQATMGMFVNTEKDISNISALTRGLRDAREMLKTGKLSLVETRDISNQITLYKDAIKELSKSDEQRTAKVIKEINDRIKQLEREAKAVRKNMDAYYTKTPTRAINFANQAKSLEELKRAYKYLEQVRNNINPNTKTGQKNIQNLNKAMDETKKKIDEIDGKNRNLKSSFDSLSASAGGLKSMLATVFSVYAVKNFVNNLVKVHGEFEMINKSLKILLHSSARAERVWGQITQLALKSPFQISELATATKQMAAYRIESDQLYEKTKMLADVSAGLGVQMSRLILAYGQVKAANFLRGTELRQFSEAGIDMLGQLAAYFTEIEGKAVSAADVFERISKRMVLFEDVDAVLTRVTSRGGTFYKMQEEQSDTLLGQIRNLKDEVAMMFHDIGESTHGILLTVVKVIRSIIKNWRTVLPVIISLMTTFVSFKAILMGYGVYLTFVQRQLVNYTTTTTAATLATHAFNTALKSNPIFLVASLIASVVAGIITYISAANSMAEANEDTEESLNSVAKIFDEQARKYKNLTDNIMAYSDKIRELKAEQDALEETDERYLKINEELSIVESARQAQISELVTLNQDYAASINTITSEFEELRKKLQDDELRKLFGMKVASNEFDVDKLNEYLHMVQEGYTAILDARSKLNGKVSGDVEYFDPALGYQIAPINIPLPDIGEYESYDEYMIKMWKLRMDSWYSLKNERTADGLLRYSQLDKSSYRDLWKGAGEGVWEVTEGGRALAHIRNMTEASANKFLSYYGISIEDVKENSDDIQGYIYDEYEKVLADNDLDADSQDLLRQLLGTAFGFEWPDVDPLLHDWQNRYNDALREYIDSLKSQGEDIVNLANSVSHEIRSRHITVEQQKEILDEEIKKLKQQIKDYETGSLELTKEQYEQKKIELKVNEYERSLLGDDDKKGGKKESPYKDMLKAIDDIHKAFKTLKKDFDAGTATVGAWEKYGAALDTALKKVGMTRDEFVERFGDLTSEQSVTEAIEWLATQAKDLDEKFDIQQHLGQWIWELKLEVEKEEFNNAVKAIDEMFSGYQLSIELDKLHVPKDFAKDFFDVDVMSLEELRKKVYDERDKFDGTDDLKKFDEYLKKIDEMETKAQQERLKKYVEYSRATIGERAKLLLDNFYELQDIEKTFVMTNSLAFNKGLIDEGLKMALDMQGKNMQDLLSMTDSDLASTWGFTQGQIDAIREFNKELMAQRDLAIEASDRKKQADLDTMDWKALKESDTFMLAMQDLNKVSEAALDKMIDQITAYKAEWADMPYSEVKEMIEHLNKLEEAKYAYYKPDDAIYAIKKDMEELGFSGTADAQTKMLDAEARITELTTELSIVEEMERLRSEKATDEEVIAELRRQGITDEAEISRYMGLESKIITSQIKDERQITSDAQKYLKLQSKIIAQYKEKERRIKEMQELVNKVFDGWDEINSLFEEGSLSSEVAELTKGVSNSVFEALAMVQAFKAAQEGLKAGGTEAEIFGYKLNMAMGIIGWIVMAIQLIAKGLKFAFEQHDKNRQKQIDAEMEKVEELQKEYEKLEKAIENAYTNSALGKYTREAKKNLEDQIAATEKMIALEEDKKKTDEDKIKGWEDEIDDLTEQISEKMDEAFSTLTDGIIDDVLSTTRDFVDAWYDAYSEAGDGMKGLEETFKDMLLNMLKQQASMQLITPFIDRYKKWLKEYVDVDGGDDTLTVQEAAAWAEKVRGTFPEVNELLTHFFEGAQGLLDTGGELSDLEKGIQGMTEDQAEVLAAYWNSCRFMLSNIDNNLARMAEATLNANSNNNPILEQLQAQTQILTTMREMMSGVLDSSGRYVQVLAV